MCRPQLPERLRRTMADGTRSVPATLATDSSRHTPCAVRSFLKGYGTRSVPATLPLRASEPKTRLVRSENERVD